MSNILKTGRNCIRQPHPTALLMHSSAAGREERSTPAEYSFRQGCGNSCRANPT